jgi:lysophospholipase L1-like esterase
MLKLSTRSLLILLLLVVSGAWLWLRAHRVAYTNFPPPATGPWLAFGDSLTEGYGATPGNDYPTLLSQRLGIEIRNFGKSGETSANALDRAEQVAELKPRVVLLCFGGNDGLQQLSASQMYQNLGQIIDRLHREGSFVVLIGIRSPSLRDRNKAGFRKLAREKKVLYISDILGGVLLKPVYMSDPLHPNDEGYRKIADRLADELRPLLPKLLPANR